ncbi:MAG: glycosyltransferase [Candidatus Contendobacter sp.]|nr:glycosyltransferase [Candidatus Contendobacter sp.]MDG4559283.1 glycosyltransferase [Candidatus Contendobacter sp.]
MNVPKVSVCVVTYNHAPYIRDCLMSVLAQAEDVSLEILVGDDFSDDETEQIVQILVGKYLKKIRYFRHNERKGPSGNYQFLIRQARGKYIAHLDGDDYWLPGKLRAQTQLLDQNPECPAVYSNALVVNKLGIACGIFNNRLSERININALLRRGNFLNNSSMLYRASLRDQILEIEEPFIDYRIHLRHARYGTLAYLNEAFVVYRVASSTSMIFHLNENVRELYWESLNDVPINHIVLHDLGLGMAEFLRMIIFRSIRLKSWSLIQKWWPRIFIGSPFGRWKMIYWTLLAVIRIGFLETIGTVCARISGSRIKVLYWH